jgi:glycosyltransferase involved in cell wall biosynthesis
MLLSIVVLSYNRPMQIKRILENFVGVEASDFNLIIKDDFSPKSHEIKKIFEEYKCKLDIDIVYHSNAVNLGYDLNLLDSFNITNSEFVFLLSDDDYLIGKKVSDMLAVLSKREQQFYFTPYTDITLNVVNRHFESSSKSEVKITDFSDFIYNSILFSGLIYHRETVLNMKLDKVFLSNCIYTQVYLAVLIVYATKSYGTIPSGVLYLGGDGDNFFGKNQSAKNSDLLSDRSKLTSNLNYQPFLLSVVESLSQSTDTRIYKQFIKEYKKRLISYGLRSRALGINAHIGFIKAYLSSGIPFFVVPFTSFLVTIIIPGKLAYGINYWAKKLLRHAG